MSFKILVVYGFSLKVEAYGKDPAISTSVTSQVIDFDTREEAEAAYSELNKSNGYPSPFAQSIKRLYS